MKTRIIALAAIVAASSTQLLAVQPVPVPDSGSTIGALAVGLVALVALRRKLAK